MMSLVTVAEPDAGDRWTAVLREAGLRATGPRVHLLVALDELGRATPEELYAHAVGASPGLNLSTVYRTLDVLSDHDLVRHTHLDHPSATYALTGRATHAHLVCRGCHAVVELDARLTASFSKRVDDRHGFVLDPAHLSVFGLCRDCAG